MSKIHVPPAIVRPIFFSLILLMLAPLACYGAAARKATGKNSTVSRSKAKLPAGYRPATPKGFRAEASEWTVDLSWWKSQDASISHYVIYTEVEDPDNDSDQAVTLERIAEIKGESFREEGLEPDHDYTYWLAAVGLNGAESDPVMVEVTTLSMTRPPLEMDVVEMKNVFTNNYKLYETEGIGTVQIRNNTSETIARLKVSFTARGFMDYPTEHELRDMEPHESRTIVIKAVLTNRVLDITEDTPLQTEISVSYYYNGQLRNFNSSRTIMLHEKHRMVWKDPDMAAVFVTPKDPLILDLSRSVVNQLGDSSSPLLLGGALFETLGVMGITYVRDPSNPYQISDGKTDTVDYVQFPVETMTRRSGDCKGMVTLFSSLLESLGIRTVMLDYPGHMFLMFSVAKGTVVPKGELEGMVFPYDGELWVPLELTLAGSSFMKAWEKGSQQFAEWSARQQLGTMDVRAAWKRYKPATPAVTTLKLQTVSRQELDRRFNNELALLGRLGVQITSPALFDAVRANPRDFRSLLQIGIRYGEEGDTAEAAHYFNRAADIAPDSAEVLNNRANLLMLQGKTEKALELYRKAAATDPSDPFILVNLARCHLKRGERGSARSSFNAAVKLRADMAERYRGLAMELAR